MNRFKYLVLTALAGICFTLAAPKAQAQVTVSIGAAPVCPYGYFDYAPYACAPYGYYGPEWFVGGVFVGAGPWFHGPHDFHGTVNNRYDPHHGYKGHMPARNEKPAANRHPERQTNFKGNESRDGRGHTVGGHPHQ